MEAHIPAELYRKIIEVLPVVCVDCIIRRDDGKYLLVERANEPMKGEWWTPGGRIRKNEFPVAAALRKAKDEVGLHLVYPRFVGYLDDKYHNSAFRVPSHCISLVFESRSIGSVKLNKEATRYKWSKDLPWRFLDRWARVT
jgi:colanic acid biosynthesis protein WcaH